MEVIRDEAQGFLRSEMLKGTAGAIMRKPKPTDEDYEVKFLQTGEKFGLVRDEVTGKAKPITLRSYKDKRQAKNRVARKQRATNRRGSK